MNARNHDCGKINEMSQKQILDRRLVVVGAIIIQLALGAIYAWSVFTPSLIDAGWSNVQAMTVFSVALLSFAIVMLWAGKRLKTIGPQKLTIFGGFLLSVGYLFAGIFGGTNFFLLTFFIGVVSGSGIGIVYVVPIAVGMRWFPDKKGLIAGLAVAGFGFGAMGWVKFAGEWLNLINTYGLSMTFIIYGVILMAMVILGASVMVFPPEGWKHDVLKNKQITANITKTEVVNLATKEMLSTPQFFAIFFTLLFGASAGLMCIGLMKLYPMEALQANGFDKTHASAIANTAMAIFFSIANGFGRIGWGVISDTLGRKTSIIIMYVIQGVCVGGFIFMAGNEITLYIGATLIGFNFGGNFALFPAITADIFGVKNIGCNYPWVYLAYGFGGIVGPILGGKLGDAGNFPLAFIICGTACVVGAILITTVKPLQHA
ncbi:MAG: OFA family MFS transporter [Deltaproteobacteria bacterium]